MENQILKFEFSTSTAIQVNSLAKDSYTASLYADFKRFLDVISNVQITSAEELRLKYDDGSRTPEEVEEAVRSQITEETKKYTDFMHNNFTVMLERFEVHNATSLREYTTLGARMNRLELIESRLEQDVVSYTKLMSENEDVDYLEVIMKLNAANSVYSASMQSGARISQLTLADYMR